ncbi:MAG: hypothetical protein O2955_20740 [Planctomycetota bacterium]|nr:hypothetical protein [Planctomycetota bacterium]MDA1214938.1 hypothetical protein [Planctomycetota bacterium]
MTDDEDFLVTFPCYCPMHSPDEPRRFIDDKDQILVICTDVDLLNRFNSYHPPRDEALLRATFNAAEALVPFLQRCADRRYFNVPYTHVAIDPEKIGAKAFIPEIRDMIRQLRRQSAHKANPLDDIPPPSLCE